MDEDLLMIDEVAALIRCSKFTVYGMVARKRIPYVKLSRRLLRFKKSEIMAWIDSGIHRIAEKSPFSEKRKSRHTRISSNSIQGIVKIAKKEVVGS